MNQNYESRIDGEITCVNFADLEAAALAGRPEDYRNQDWMVTGPFVARTDGAFETEYLYEREKILAIDYLAEDGGEQGIAPYLGLRGHNRYEGCANPIWTMGIRKWDMLRFDPDDGDSACDEALYMTEQRNCVFYAATYVRCESRKRAVICYENSGCQLFLNGQLINDDPFGRVKGVCGSGRLLAVTFEPGLNLLLFKLRPGYICDTVDLSMVYFGIYPMAAESDRVGLTYPMKTAVYYNRNGKDMRVFPCYAAAFADADDVCVSVGDWQKESIGHMFAGQVQLVRAELPAENAMIDCDVRIDEAGAEGGAGSFHMQSTEHPAFRGTELVTTSFHFDTTYHQEQRVYAMGAIYITREILKEMRKDPNFKAIISEVDYLHPYYSIYPEDRAFLKQQFIDGNAEADCFYNQPNEMTSSPEGMTRNLVYGQLYHRDVMGRICDVYSPGDVFGHFNQMSQMCAKGGCGGISWGKHIFGFWPTFRHVSPDGTSLIHRRGGLSRDNAARWGLDVCEEGARAMTFVPGYPVDGDLSWMKDTTLKARFAIPTELRQALDNNEKRIVAESGVSPFGATSRDMSLYHAGTSLTRTDFKQANRMAENLLITAEKLSAFAAMHGAEYPERALDKAWRQVLCGQHHDSITGTNNEVSFVDLMIQYREAVELAADICDRASKYIASHVCTKDGSRAIVVFNPHAWDRHEHVEFTLRSPKPFAQLLITDLKGEPVSVQLQSETEENGEYVAKLLMNVRVPSCGYTTYYVADRPKLVLPGELQLPTVSLPVVDDGVSIDNSLYRVTVDPEQGGGILSIYNKVINRDMVDFTVNGPANRIVALKETHDRMETQHEFYTTGHKLTSENEPAVVTRTTCPEYEMLTIKYDLGNVVHVTQTITLRRDDQHIYFTARLDDYRDEDDLMTVTFPLSLKGAKPIFDDRFAPQVRTSSRRSLSFRTHQFAQASHCAVYAANQWMDYGPTVTVQLTDGIRTGAFNFGMTQVIRPNKKELILASEKLLTALTKKAIPVTPFPDVQQGCHGSQIIHFNEDLYSDTRIVLTLNGVPNAYEDAIAAKYRDAYARLEKAAVRHGVAAMYFRDTDNDWAKPIDVLLVKASSMTSLNRWIDNASKSLASGRFLPVEAIFGDVPDMVTDYGVALLNTGNIACSVEKDGMLNMMLFHTAEFYGNVGNTHCGSKLVPERKSHMFRYALLPHAYSYREAEVYQRALELNDPLFAVSDAERAADADLPESASLLRADKSVIVTAVKAGGYPYASMKGIVGTLAERGIALRCFEPNGVAADAKIQLGFNAVSADRTNLLEEEPSPLQLTDNVIDLPVGAHSIETVVIRPAEDAVRTGTAILGAQHEITEPTYIRSWEHDLGTMPMGYLSLCAVIGRDPQPIDDTHFRVKVSVANNHTDISASGTAELKLPDGWTATPATISYDVPSGGCHVEQVVIEKPTADAKGIIRLEYAHLGQQFEDIFEVGYHNPDMNVELVGDTIKVTVLNDNDQMLRGELGLATPIETWGDFNGRSQLGVACIGPFQQPVVVPAHGRSTYEFPLTGDTSVSFWAVAKLMVNGRISFKGVMHRPVQPHVLWAHNFIGEIYADGGSLRKLNALH